jgi:hypothetical protein
MKNQFSASLTAIPHPATAKLARLAKARPPLTEKDKLIIHNSADAKIIRNYLPRGEMTTRGSQCRSATPSIIIRNPVNTKIHGHLTET